MWKWIKNKFARTMNRRELSEYDALVIHDIIMASGETEFIDKLKDRMKVHAESSMGMYAIAAAWYGQPVPDSIRYELKKRFNFDSDLQARNLTSWDGRAMELGVLASALPHEMTMKYFHFDMEAKAAEQGVSLEDVRAFLNKYVKEIKIGKWGDEEIHFYKSMRASIDGEQPEEELWKYATVLGLGGVGDQGEDSLVAHGKLAVTNVKKLMEADAVFMDKFDFLKNIK
jgi:hypothetical protein